MNTKLHILFMSFATLTIILASCSKSGENREKPLQEAEFSALKEQLLTLNSALPQNETVVTRAKWWKYVLVAAADAGGFFLAGGSGATAVTAGCSVSTLVWNFFKDNKKAEAKTKAETNLIDGIIPSLTPSEIALSYVEGAGLTHNKVILDLYEDYGESMFEYDDNTMIALVEEKVALETNCSIKDASLGLAARRNYVDKTVSAYISAATIDEFIDNLELAAPKRAALLEIVNIILDGFDSIDAIEDNGSYNSSVQKIISESGLEDGDKEMLCSTASVANASARLWNTEQ